MNKDQEAVWREEFLKTYSVICKIDLVRLRAILEIQEREPDVMGNNIVNSLTLYLAGRHKGQEEFKHWNEVHGRIVAGMNEEKKTIVANMRKEIESLKKSRNYSRLVCEEQSKEITELKKEIEEYRLNAIGKMSLEIINENNVLRELIESAKDLLKHSAGMEGRDRWLKKAEEVLK